MSHAETWAKSPKQRFVAGGPPAQNNIIGAGVRAQLSDWPYFSSLFYVCPQSEAISPGAAITININQVLDAIFVYLILWSHAVQIDYSVKLFADLGDTNSTYNSHRAYSFSDKIFTAGFSSVMLKVRLLHRINCSFSHFQTSLIHSHRLPTEVQTAASISALLPPQSFWALRVRRSPGHTPALGCLDALFQTVKFLPAGRYVIVIDFREKLF